METPPTVCGPLDTPFVTDLVSTHHVIDCADPERGSSMIQRVISSAVRGSEHPFLSGTSNTDLDLPHLPCLYFYFLAPLSVQAQLLIRSREVISEPPVPPPPPPRSLRYIAASAWVWSVCRPRRGTPGHPRDVWWCWCVGATTVCFCCAARRTRQYEREATRLGDQTSFGSHLVQAPRFLLRHPVPVASSSRILLRSFERFVVAPTLPMQ